MLLSEFYFGEVNIVPNHVLVVHAGMEWNDKQELKATIKKDLKIDDVDELADDMADLMDEFQEINEALARNFATPDDIDEADLEAELDMLEDELEEELVGGADSVPSYLQDSALPAQPTAAPGSKIPVAAGQKVDEYGLPLDA